MVSPPLKNMSSSDWIIIPTIGEGIKVVFQITNQPILCPYAHHKHLPPALLINPPGGANRTAKDRPRSGNLKGKRAYKPSLYWYNLRQRKQPALFLPEVGVILELDWISHIYYIYI